MLDLIVRSNRRREAVEQLYQGLLHANNFVSNILIGLTHPTKSIVFCISYTDHCSQAPLNLPQLPAKIGGMI